MERIHTLNINSPIYFDRIWSIGTAYFDRVRMEAFTNCVKDGDRVLDVGAGVFSWGQYLLSRTKIQAKVHAVDFSPVAAKKTCEMEGAINYVLGDVLLLPYADGQFDVVGAGELIEHLEDPRALVQEMARVTRPRGMIVIGTLNPHCPQAEGKNYPEHLWDFEIVDLLQMLFPYGTPWYQPVGNYNYVYCRKL